MGRGRRTTPADWEAKDEKDSLPVEMKKKFEAGYPRPNIFRYVPTTSAEAEPSIARLTGIWGAPGSRF